MFFSEHSAPYIQTVKHAINDGFQQVFL